MSEAKVYYPVPVEASGHALELVRRPGIGQALLRAVAQATTGTELIRLVVKVVATALGDAIIEAIAYTAAGAKRFQIEYLVLVGEAKQRALDRVDRTVRDEVVRETLKRTIRRL